MRRSPKRPAEKPTSTPMACETSLMPSPTAPATTPSRTCREQKLRRKLSQAPGARGWGRPQSCLPRRLLCRPRQQDHGARREADHSDSGSHVARRAACHADSLQYSRAACLRSAFPRQQILRDTRRPGWRRSLKGPLHRTVVDLLVDPRGLDFATAADGMRQDNVEFVLAGCDSQGNRVNYQDRLGAHRDWKRSNMPERPWRVACTRACSLICRPDPVFCVSRAGFERWPRRIAGSSAGGRREVSRGASHELGP